MTDQLAESIDAEVSEVAEVETDTPMSGESPEQSGDTGDNQESNESKPPLFSEEGQQVFNAKMAEGKRAQRELEADKQKLAAQLQEIQAQLPQNQRPTLPELPDPYSLSDEEYREAITQRDTRVQEIATFDANANAQAQYNQSLQAQAAQKQQEQIQTTVGGFNDNAKKHGIEAAELNQAINTVNQYGISEDLGLHIMGRNDGPLIAKFLAANPLELDNLNSVTPLQAAVMIETQIASKAAALKPRTTSAPDPLQPLQGGGSPPKERGPKGATYT